MNKEDILVSICCITYNHASYIRQCLDGFMMQKTDFKFEVLIHDDASTDGTEEIIREYEKKYPEVIKPLYEKENQWVQGRRGNKFFNYPRAIGKYIALCEGDDYWIDPYKLQKQVDYMENHIDCSLVFHNAWKLHSSGLKEEVNRTPLKKIRTDTIIYKGVSEIPTGSMFFHKAAIQCLPLWFSLSPVGDYPLTIHLSMLGRIHYINKIMSVYRVDSIGSWSLRMRQVSMRIDHFKRKAQMLYVLNKETKNNYIIAILYSFVRLCLGFLYAIIIKYPYFKQRNDERK